MPDQYGFNHLGDDVRCIDCPSGGPLWRWPEHKRARQGRTHGRALKAVSTDLRRQRSLLTAPTTTSNEEKEATMATAKKGESAKPVAIDVLRKAGQPLQASEIAKQVLASGRCAGLKSKTPEATISAMLAVGSKAGGPFKRVDKCTYTLAEAQASRASRRTRSRRRRQRALRRASRPPRSRSLPRSDRRRSARPRSARANSAALSPAGSRSRGSRSFSARSSTHRPTSSNSRAAQDGQKNASEGCSFSSGRSSR